ncbi:MAG: LytTR family DNA-binding domain-containing protein [Paracoccaceae bacterium]
MPIRFDILRDPVRVLPFVGAVLLFAGYWAIFYLTTEDGFTRAAIAAANNTLPAIGLAWLTHLVLDRYVWTANPSVGLGLQVPLAVLFALVWYVAILVLRELRGDWLTEGFAIRPFVPIAFAWQMFQGITFYALTALASLSISLSRRLRSAEEQTTIGEQVTERASMLLIATGDGAETVAIQAISTISGAGDYTEVRLPGRAIYSTTTLAEFETRLPQDRFFRAHRSHLVNMDAVERSEPAGNGRTTLHLADGRTITSSRAGTRLLRELAL